MHVFESTSTGPTPERSPRRPEMSRFLAVDAKTSFKAGKEKIQLNQLAVGTLVKVVFDRGFNAVAIKIEKEKS